MEEIDIAELLKRVKEGEAPKRILINGLEYCYEDEATFGDYYRDTEKYGKVFFSNEYDFRAIANAKIKILDKPKIEEFTTLIHCDDTRSLAYGLADITIKLNEIIRFINKEEK